MKKTIMLAGILLLASLLSVSCEKANFGDDGNQEKEGEVKVMFNVDKFEQVPFNDGIYLSRSNVDVSNICTNINMAIFGGSEKVKSVNQKTGDSDFGKISVSLAKGTYKIVVIAHSCNGTATISSPDKITFPDNKVSDTFYYCADIVVDDAKSYDLELKRAVAMFRLIAQDGKPENVKSMKFFYSGGSSTFNAVTGYGCVNSRQTEVRKMEDSYNGKSTQIDVYTFPHDESGLLKITITAQDALGNSVCEKVFDDVPIQRNKITQYSGNFFISSAGSSFSIKADNTWAQENYQY